MTLQPLQNLPDLTNRLAPAIIAFQSNNLLIESAMSREAFHITPEAYFQAENDLAGFCIGCKEVTTQGTYELDVRNHPCAVCDENTVFGIEQAVIEGYVTIY